MANGQERALIASSDALHQIFAARSVAVVGASNNSGKLGYALFDTIRRSGYEGVIYPVTLRDEQVQGMRAYRSLGAIPGPVDLALILVPARRVPEVLREAAIEGTQVAVVLSAGYRESGLSEREDNLKRVAHECGVRILGPNMQGFAYLPNRLCAMFWPALTVAGPLAVIGQSGSVTAALAEWASEDGLGISAAVNLGTQIDLDVTDLLEFFVEDTATSAIALHVEVVEEGHRFLDVARRVAQIKPLAILKSAHSEGDRRLAASHTGSRTGRDQLFDAASWQRGLVRAGDLQELYDFGKALATMRQPRGNRLLVVSTSGGGATLVVDDAEIQGLVLPALPEIVVKELRGLGLPAEAGLANPLELPSLDATLFEQVIALVERHNVADTCLVSFGHPVPGSATVIKRLARQVRGSIAVAFYGGGEVERAARVELNGAGIPVYPTPERAVRAIAALVRSGPPRSRPGATGALGDVVDK